ncbi:MAG: peptidoglycan bridge formation glycyltransferase FemA/FemB family protein, partial [Oscillochloris sp.]|nr:peptidoglycan bridge formation glycyltransferase FemA/FemB family protein [Oscillochloris sp.]
GLGAGLLVAPEGPLLPWEQHDLARAALRAILEAAEQAAAVYGALALRIEPRIAPPRPRVLRTFRRAPVDLVTTETLYVDLAPPPETILAQMQPKGRYNIRLAARRGVTVAAEYSPAAVQRFYAILQEASLRDDFFIESPAFFNDLLAELVPAGHAQLLFAKHADDTLGALLLITYGQRGTYLYGGIANQKRNLMAGYALQWAAMLRARAVGCTCYDFYGYEPYGAPDHLYASFSRFKRQFGGQAIRFIGAHDTFFLDRLSDAVIQVAKQSVGMA